MIFFWFKINIFYKKKKNQNKINLYVNMCKEKNVNYVIKPPYFYFYF